MCTSACCAWMLRSTVSIWHYLDDPSSFVVLQESFYIMLSWSLDTCVIIVLRYLWSYSSQQQCWLELLVMQEMMMIWTVSHIITIPNSLLFPPQMIMMLYHLLVKRSGKEMHKTWPVGVRESVQLVWPYTSWVMIL